MNVSCPSCTKQFRVNDATVAAGPRKVKCGNCGHIWPVSRQSAEPARGRPRAAPAGTAPAAVPESPLPPPPPPRPAPTASSRGASSRAASSREASNRAAPTAPARAERRGGTLWVWWLLLVVLIAALVAGGWFGRGWLVAQWPPAIRFYDWIGLDLPRIEIVERTEAATGEGATRRLTVGGVLANHADTALPVPPLLFTLYNAGGEALNQWLEPPPVATLAPGATARFTSTVGISSGAGAEPPRWEVVLQRDAVAGPEAADPDPGGETEPAGEAGGETTP